MCSSGMMMSHFLVVRLRGQQVLVVVWVWVWVVQVGVVQVGVVQVVVVGHNCRVYTPTTTLLFIKLFTKLICCSSSVAAALHLNAE
jgi:hypothetical protein